MKILARMQEETMKRLVRMQEETLYYIYELVKVNVAVFAVCHCPVVSAHCPVVFCTALFFFVCACLNISNQNFVNNISCQI